MRVLRGGLTLALCLAAPAASAATPAAPAAPAAAAAATAAAPDAIGPVHEGTLFTNDGKRIVDVPLRHTAVRIRVSGYLAEVDVEQTFTNPYDRKIEAVYAFPLPTGAAVDRLELRTGDEIVRGVLMERAAATATYEVAKAAGHIAALLEEERANLFTQSVANIEPHAEVNVALHYVQELHYDAGAYELVFPLVAAPRYTPAGAGASTAPVAAPTFLPPDTRSSHDVDLAVELDAAVPFHELRSPSHHIDGAVLSPSTARVRLAAGDTIPNKDFVLRWTVAGDAPAAAVLAHRAPGDGAPDGDGAFFLMVQPPDTLAAEDVAPRELVFVLDTSSSMAGAPLAKAKEVVRRALAALRPDDTFQIVRFADRTSALGAAPIANRPRNVALALGWLDALGAEGGTEMIDGVRAALDFPHDPDRLRVVLFLTDGYVGNEDDVLATVHARLGASRLFSFGVGSAVNRYLLEEMAAFGRGDCSVVRPDEDTATAVDRFLARVATPVMTDVTVDWKGLPVHALEPAAVPDLFLGQPLVVHGLYGAPGGRATIEVHGTIAGAPVTIPVDVTLPARADGNAGVAAVWAKARIRALERGLVRGVDGGAGAREITRLALAHGLLTRYTSFVAVSAHVTGGGKAKRVPVPLERPEHVGRGGGLGLSGSGYGGGGAGSGSIGLVAHATASASLSAHTMIFAARTAKPAVVTVGVATVAGSVDKSMVSRVIHAHLPKVRYLYERVMKSRLRTGRIVLALTIDSSGVVADARVESSDFPDGELAAALVAEARSWAFPSAEGGGTIVVRHPFLFAPSAPMPAKKDDPLDSWWEDTLPPAGTGAGTEAR